MMAQRWKKNRTITITKAPQHQKKRQWQENAQRNGDKKRENNAHFVTLQMYYG